VKNIIRGLLSAALLAGAFLSMDASSVSATPANTGQGTGCYVRDANDVLHFDPDCKVYLVIKLDAAGNLAFVEYQDAGQVPAGAPLPKSTIRNEYDQCLDFGPLGIACGTVVESTTPSGAYKSSFKYHG
jgi:hypothetical protein